jgi:glycosyltransferase involved in cell wall biosynthesis
LLIYTNIKMNILFVFFSLPHLSQSAMYSDMVNEFQKNGHNVYPMAPIISDSSKSYISIENRIEVLRVKTLDVFSKNVFEKGFANLLLSYQYKNAFTLFWKNRAIELVIVTTPSVMFADFISDIKKSKGSKVYLMQKDIFPQNAVDLGLMKKKSLIFKFFKKKECKLLAAADIVGCTSPGNIKYFLNNYSFLDKKKVQLLYNNSKLFNRSDEFKFNNKDFSNMFTVVFGGNMGKPQQLENVLNLAKRTLNFKDVIFIVVGKGTENDKLKEVASQMGVNNLKFIDSLSRENYFKLISSCNLGLISLHQDFTVPNTPMKLNDYLNAGIPVLASIDRSNDLGELLVNNKMGKYAYSDSPDILFEQFLKFYEDKDLCNELGKNGYDFCLNNLSVKNAYQDVLKQLDAL